MASQPDSVLSELVREWWAEIKPDLAHSTRARLVKTSFALGIAATVAMRAANRIAEWGVK